MFPQGLEPCCFPPPEGRLGFSFLYVAPCTPGDTESISQGSSEGSTAVPAPSIHTNPLGQRQQCPPCCHMDLPLSRPHIPGDVALALPSLQLTPCSHQLPQAAVQLQRLRDFPGALGSEGVFLQAAKARNAPVSARCHIPSGATSLLGGWGGGQQVLVTHCRVTSLWLVSRASARKVAPSSLMELCWRLWEIGVKLLPQQGQGLGRAAGQWPPALGFACPHPWFEKGVWSPSIPDQESPSLLSHGIFLLP